MDWQLMMDSFDIYASKYNTEISRQLSESEILNRVVFIKPTHFEMSAYMNAADIACGSVCKCRKLERAAYGRVAAEAMACGKEVIASNSGALPELLDGHGFLFKEGNVQELKELLVSRLENSDQLYRVNLSPDEIISFLCDWPTLVFKNKRQ